MNSVVDLNVGITLTTNLDSQASSLLASLGWALFWEEKKLKNNLGKIWVNFEIVTEIFRSAFKNFEFIIVKL